MDESGGASDVNAMQSVKIKTLPSTLKTRIPIFMPYLRPPRARVEGTRVCGEKKLVCLGKFALVRPQRTEGVSLRIAAPYAVRTSTPRKVPTIAISAMPRNSPWPSTPGMALIWVASEAG